MYSNFPCDPRNQEQYPAGALLREPGLFSDLEFAVRIGAKPEQLFIT
jgi:hypothetical protein